MTVWEGRAYRLFNGIDGCNREGLGIEADCSRPDERMIRVLDPLIEQRGKSRALRGDNGTEIRQCRARDLG